MSPAGSFMESDSRQALCLSWQLLHTSLDARAMPANPLLSRTDIFAEPVGALDDGP